MASLLLFSLHGAIFLALKTTGGLRRRARRAAVTLAAPALLAVAGVAAWVGLAITGTARPGALPGTAPAALVIVTLAAIAGAGVLAAQGREGPAFVATATAVVTLTGAAFAALFPRVMVSTVAAGDSLTLWNAASAHQTLLVMTVVAAIFTPFVLAYQGWTYWVFRQRLTRPPAASEHPPGPGGGGGLPPAGTRSGPHPDPPPAPR